MFLVNLKPNQRTLQREKRGDKESGGGNLEGGGRGVHGEVRGAGVGPQAPGDGGGLLRSHGQAEAAQDLGHGHALVLPRWDGSY